MRFNSDAAIAQARRDIRRYGSLFNVVAAATRREDGVLVLPREPDDRSASGNAELNLNKASAPRRR